MYRNIPSSIVYVFLFLVLVLVLLLAVVVFVDVFVFVFVFVFLRTSRTKNLFRGNGAKTRLLKTHRSIKNSSRLIIKRLLSGVYRRGWECGARACARCECAGACGETLAGGSWAGARGGRWFARKGRRWRRLIVVSVCQGKNSKRVCGRNEMRPPPPPNPTKPVPHVSALPPCTPYESSPTTPPGDASFTFYTNHNTSNSYILHYISC